MLTLISPAKALDFDSPLPTRKASQPRMLAEADRLAEVMAAKSPDALADLMELSSDLALLNHDRFQEWEPAGANGQTRPAVLAFNGDVYQAMGRERFGERDYTHAQKHLRILSGLYGVLRPLDLIQPYRLEMGAPLVTDRGSNLYQWWGSAITDQLKADLEGRRSPFVVNLASKEYFGAVQAEALDAPVITPVFKDFSPGEYRVVSFFAKRARGMMAAWMILNRISSRRALRSFDEGGYRFEPSSSTASTPVFVRDH